MPSIAQQNPVTDGRCRLSDSAWDNNMPIGADGTNGSFSAGLQFTVPDVPQGATILSASLRLYVHSAQFTNDLDVHAEDVDSGAAGNTGTHPKNRTKTTAFTTYPHGTTTGSYLAVDVASVIQEIVDRPGWAPGNYITLLVVDQLESGYGYIHFWFEDEPYAPGDELPPTLDVEYTTASSELTGTVSGTATASAVVAVVRGLTASISDGAITSAAFDLSSGQTQHAAASESASQVTVTIAVRRSLSATAAGVVAAAVVVAELDEEFTIDGIAYSVIDGGWTLQVTPLASDRRGYAGTLRSAVTSSRPTYVRIWSLRLAAMPRADAVNLVNSLTSYGPVTLAGGRVAAAGVSCIPRNVRLREHTTLGFAGVEADFMEVAA